MRPKNKGFIYITLCFICVFIVTLLQQSVLNLKNFNFDLFFINLGIIFSLANFLILKKIRDLKSQLQSKLKQTDYKLKIGLDIHGCIDYDPSFFAKLSQLLVDNGHEVHITTGAMINDKIIKELEGYGMKWTHLWSISDYYKKQPGVEMWFDENGRPWIEEELWNRAKGEYAKSQNLDLCIDDTEVYKNYFTTSVAICNIINKTGKIKKEKAKMPPKTSIIKH